MEVLLIGNRRRLFKVAELEGNLAALRPWNLREFEIPDVIAFDDFVHSRRSIAESLCGSQRALTWDRALRFPYPNGRKLRELVVLGAPDLAVLRTSAGRLARPVERRLSWRSFGYRTIPSDVAWTFSDDNRARWNHFIESAIRLLRRDDINAMCAYDIARYYGSIDHDRLETRLHDLGCDLHAIAVALAALRKWAAVDRISGLPIGPEACAILGNAFLIPVDRMLMSVGVEYVRWMDDYKLMGADALACRALEGPFDHFLSTQGLTRSVEKTEYYDNTLAAIAALRDGRLDSLGYRLRSGAEDADEDLRATFEREILGANEISRSLFRFIVKTLGNRRDDYAAAAVANTTTLANVDPRLSGEYLGWVGLTKPPIVDAMLAQLHSKPSDERDALDLHFLRALAQKRGDWGSEEGVVFESIAESNLRRPPVRCWAVHALSRTSRWRQSTLMESAEAEVDPLVRRIKITTLTKVRPGRKRQQFSRHMCARHPDLAPTVLWLDAA